MEHFEPELLEFDKVEVESKSFSILRCCFTISFSHRWFSARRHAVVESRTISFFLASKSASTNSSRLQQHYKGNVI